MGYCGNILSTHATCLAAYRIVVSTSHKVCRSFHYQRRKRTGKSLPRDRLITSSDIIESRNVNDAR